jgi:hypothetical protein
MQPSSWRFAGKWHHFWSDSERVWKHARDCVEGNEAAEAAERRRAQVFAGWRFGENDCTRGQERRSHRIWRVRGSDSSSNSISIKKKGFISSSFEPSCAQRRSAAVWWTKAPFPTATSNVRRPGHLFFPRRARRESNTSLWKTANEVFRCSTQSNSKWKAKCGAFEPH